MKISSVVVAEILVNTRIATRLLVVTALAAVGMVAISWIALTHMRDQMLNDRKDKIREHVQIAQSLVEHYQALEAQGSMTHAEAQAGAVAGVEALRYAGGEFFFIISKDLKLVAHPFRRENIAKNVSNFKDPKGNKIYVMFSDAVRDQGGGFIDYWSYKNAGEQWFQKTSYVKSFEPWSWIVGSGLYMDDLDVSFREAAVRVAEPGLAVAVFILVACMGIAASVSRPLARITAAVLHLADNDMATEIPYRGRKGEVGLLARALELCRQNLQTVDRMRQESTDIEARNRSEKRSALWSLADDFEGAVGDVIGTVSEAATRLETSAEILMRTAGRSQELTTVVAAASREASTNVHSVASAAEQMAASVSEIDRQVQESVRIAENAVTQARQTNDRIARLSTAASRISDVVELINNIAGQTNLLALNATIEAARAGEAGSGFAVVASEVKILADQTAKATGEISQQIAEMQSATEGSVGAIREIGTTIAQISQISLTIALAVEQQGVATQEIAQRVQQAAGGTKQVSSNIVDVQRGADETGSASSQVLSAAQSLSSESNRLKAELGRILASVRAA